MSEFRVNPRIVGAVQLIDDARISPKREIGPVKYLFMIGKVVVTVACLWYVLRRLDIGNTWHALLMFHFKWVALAVLLGGMQIPLLALRLRSIIDALTGGRPRSLTFPAVNMITAIYSLLAQVLPAVVGEAVRAWMLTRYGCAWRISLTSVIIDSRGGPRNAARSCPCHPAVAVRAYGVRRLSHIGRHTVCRGACRRRLDFACDAVPIALAVQVALFALGRPSRRRCARRVSRSKSAGYLRRVMSRHLLTILTVWTSRAEGCRCRCPIALCCSSL